MTTLKAIGITTAALAIAAVCAAPAQAAPAGIGFGTTLRIPTAAMYSAPEFGTYYVGTAHEGDNLADVCWISSDGAIWDMVLDRNGFGGDHFGDTAAFIPETDLANETQSLECSSLRVTAPDSSLPGLGMLVPATPDQNNTGMSSAPYNNTRYVGSENFSTYPYPMTLICSAVTGQETWEMVLDFVGQTGNHFAYTIAFVPDFEVTAAAFDMVSPC